MCDAEFLLIQYMQLPCTIYIGTDGGKQHHSGSYSWIICSPGREQLCLNAAPVDRWFKCQNSLRSEAVALAAVTLYLDELATWATLIIKCRLTIFVDSTSAISNVNVLREQIPKRQYADNTDILSVMRSAEHVITRYTLEHVKSHQDNKTDFDNLPFNAQLNVLCDRMATNQMKRQGGNEWEATQPCPLIPKNLPIEVSSAGKPYCRTISNASEKKSSWIDTGRFFNRNTNGRTKFGSPSSRGTPLHDAPVALRWTSL